MIDMLERVRLRPKKFHSLSLRTKKLLANAPLLLFLFMLFICCFYASTVLCFPFSGFLSFGENSDLFKACSRSTLTIKYQQLHLPLLSDLFTVVDCPLSTPTNRIYGIIKKDGLKPQSTLLHQTLAATRPSSRITSALAS